MANETAARIKSAAPYDSADFPAVATEIEERAFLMMYESAILSKLVKPVGVGVKGTAIHWPYFDPTAIVTSASMGTTLAEDADLTARVHLTNASKYIVASEFGVQGFVTDTLLESASFDFKGELTRQIGIGMAVKEESYLITKLAVATASGGFNTFLATNKTDGLSYTKIAAAKSLLDAKLVEIEGTKSLVMTDYAYFLTAKGTYSTTYQAAQAPYGDEVMRRWYITSMFGDINVYRDNHIAVASSMSWSYMFVKDAVGLWSPREFRIEPERNASARGVELNATMRKGASILIPAWGLRIRSWADTPK